MKTEQEIKNLLDQLEKIIERIKFLKNPIDDYKMESCHFRMLLAQRDLYKFLLGDDGYVFDEYYDDIEFYLNSLENDET